MNPFEAFVRKGSRSAKLAAYDTFKNFANSAIVPLYADHTKGPSGGRHGPDGLHWDSPEAWAAIAWGVCVGVATELRNVWVDRKMFEEEIEKLDPKGSHRGRVPANVVVRRLYPRVHGPAQKLTGYPEASRLRALSSGLFFEIARAGKGRDQDLESSVDEPRLAALPPTSLAHASDGFRRVYRDDSRKLSPLTRFDRMDNDYDELFEKTLVDFMIDHPLEYILSVPMAFGYGAIEALFHRVVRLGEARKEKTLCVASPGLSSFLILEPQIRTAVGFAPNRTSAPTSSSTQQEGSGPPPRVFDTVEILSRFDLLDPAVNRCVRRFYDECEGKVGRVRVLRPKAGLYEHSRFVYAKGIGGFNWTRNARLEWATGGPSKGLRFYDIEAFSEDAQRKKFVDDVLSGAEEVPIGELDPVYKSPA